MRNGRSGTRMRNGRGGARVRRRRRRWYAWWRCGRLRCDGCPMGLGGGLSRRGRLGRVAGGGRWVRTRGRLGSGWVVGRGPGQDGWGVGGEGLAGRLGEGGAGVEAGGGMFGHGGGEDRVERGWETVAAQGQRLRGQVQGAADDLVRVGGIEGGDAGEQPVQGAGQGVLIGAVVEFGAGHLFGRGVGQRRGEHALLGQMGGIGAQAGDPEVGEEYPLALTTAGAGQQDVGRLHVTVQHASAVRVVQRVGDPFDDLHGPLGRQRHRVDGGRVDPVDVLHADPQLFALGATIEDGDDAGMVEPGGEIGLPLEPRANTRVGEQVPIEQLERGQPVQPRMPRQVHRAHAALAERPLDGEPGEHLTNLEHRDPLPASVADQHGTRDRV